VYCSTLALLRYNDPPFRSIPLIDGYKYRFCRFWEMASQSCGEVGMTGDYSRFTASYTHEELVEHVLLSPAEHALVATGRGDVHRQAVAVWLKTVPYRLDSDLM
jgi:hypothetical protein